MTGFQDPRRAYPLLPRTFPQGVLQASTCYVPSPMHGKQSLCHVLLIKANP